MAVNTGSSNYLKEHRRARDNSEQWHTVSRTELANPKLMRKIKDMAVKKHRSLGDDKKHAIVISRRISR
jgi:hypothetical protein